MQLCKSPGDTPVRRRNVSKEALWECVQADSKAAGTWQQGNGQNLASQGERNGRRRRFGPPQKIGVARDSWRTVKNAPAEQALHVLGWPWGQARIGERQGRDRLRGDDSSWRVRPQKLCSFTAAQRNSCVPYGIWVWAEGKSETWFTSQGSVFRD